MDFKVINEKNEWMAGSLTVTAVELIVVNSSLLLAAIRTK